MSIAAYAKIIGPDIEGECSEDEHIGWQQLESFMWGVQNQATLRRSSSGSVAAGEADFRPVTFRFILDMSYPSLCESCWLGQHHDEVTVDFHRAGTAKQRYLQYKFKNALITDVNIVAETQGHDELPIVEFTIAYSQINVEYFRTDEAGGAVSGSVPVGFDLEKVVGA